MQMCTFAAEGEMTVAVDVRAAFGKRTGARVGAAGMVLLGAAALAACGAGGSSEGSSSAGSSTSSPTPSVSLDARCQLGAVRTVLQPSQAIVSSRCQVAKSGTAYVAGIVRSGGQEQPFFAQNTGASWQTISEQQLCSAAAGLAGVTAYCNGGRPDDTKLVLPTTKPPKATASPTATAVPSNSASTQ